MNTKTQAAVVILVAAAGLYFVTRAPKAEAPRSATVDQGAADGEFSDADLVSPAEGAAVDTQQEPERRTVVAEEPADEEAAPLGSHVLRVILDSLSEEDAAGTQVTLTVEDDDGLIIREIEATWLCEGLTSEFDLDPVFAQAGERGISHLSVAIDPPVRLIKWARIKQTDGVQSESGQTVYEARVSLPETLFWSQLTLAVRDEETREHLQELEVHCVSSDYMGLRRQPVAGGIYDALGRGLNSPIALTGGYAADEPKLVGGISLSSAASEASEFTQLVHRSDNDRGTFLYARAPGYEWGRLVVDFSAGGERELLLGKEATLGVRLANVQLERYEALGEEATLFVRQPGWGVGHVWVQTLDEALALEGLALEGLEPGDFSVSVELGREWSPRARPVLAREEFSLAAGEAREVTLTLSEPPEPPDRVSVSGVLSFPAFAREADVELKLFHQDWGRGDPDGKLTIAEMERVGGSLSTWSFHLEDIQVGRCHVHVLPFMKNWMIDVPEGGLAGVELVIPELTELVVETVDARTGDRVPLERLRYIYKEEVPGRVHNIWDHQIWTAFDGEPGLFRVWTAPGTVYVGTWMMSSEVGYASTGMDLELGAGLHSHQLELVPPYTMRIEFRVEGAELPYDDMIYWSLHEAIRAVDHEGEASYVHKKVAQLTAPGIYEIDLEGVGEDRFLPVDPRRVEVKEGETVEVVVELERR